MDGYGLSIVIGAVDIPCCQTSEVRTAYSCLRYLTGDTSCFLGWEICTLADI